MFKTMLTGWLMQVAEAYAEARSISVTQAMGSVTGDVQLFYRLNGGAGFRVDTYDRWLQQFSDAWPAKAEWPADVLRPSPAEPVGAASHQIPAAAE